MTKDTRGGACWAPLRAGGGLNHTRAPGNTHGDCQHARSRSSASPTRGAESGQAVSEGVLGRTRRGFLTGVTHTEAETVACSEADLLSHVSPVQGKPPRLSFLKPGHLLYKCYFSLFSAFR